MRTPEENHSLFSHRKISKMSGISKSTFVWAVVVGLIAFFTIGGYNPTLTVATLLHMLSIGNNVDVSVVVINCRVLFCYII